MYRVKFNPEIGTSLDLISIVDKPAIEADFIRLENQPLKVDLQNDEKQYVTGPVLIPEKEIYRRNKNGREFYIVFTAEDIEAYRNDFFQNGKTKLSNLDHKSGQTIEAYLNESWIVVDPAQDKSAALGFKDVKAGTLFATYHVPDKAEWNEVVKRNGFSVEAKIDLEQLEMSEQLSEFEIWLEELVDEILAEMAQ